MKCYLFLAIVLATASSISAQSGCGALPFVAGANMGESEDSGGWALYKCNDGTQAYVYYCQGTEWVKSGEDGCGGAAPTEPPPVEPWNPQPEPWNPQPETPWSPTGGGQNNDGSPKPPEKLTDCAGDPQTMANGKFYGDSKQYKGFHCDPGYALNQKMERPYVYCAGGQWTYLNVYCIEKRCSGQPNIVNGRLDLGPANGRLDSYARIMCNAGYEIDAGRNQYYLKCQSSRSGGEPEWEPVLASCKATPRECSPPFDPPSGFWEGQGTFNPGASYSLRCDNGYNPQHPENKPAYINCGQDGQWDERPDMFSCRLQPRF